MIKPAHRGDDNSNILADWIMQRLDDIKDFVRADFASYRPRNFVRDKYQKPAEQVAYRDAWLLVGFIGEGYFEINQESDLVSVS